MFLWPRLTKWGYNRRSGDPRSTVPSYASWGLVAMQEMSLKTLQAQYCNQTFSKFKQAGTNTENALYIPIFPWQSGDKYAPVGAAIWWWHSWLRWRNPHFGNEYIPTLLNSHAHFHSWRRQLKHSLKLYLLSVCKKQHVAGILERMAHPVRSPQIVGPGHKPQIYGFLGIYRFINIYV